jgi:hypothetical protein
MRSSLSVLVLLAVGVATAAPAVSVLREVGVETGQGRVVEVPYWHVPLSSLPEPDFAWGMYFDHNRIPPEYKSEEYVKKCLAQMAGLGFNTCTFYGDAATVQRHLALASEVGLLSEQPVLILGEAPIATDHAVPELVGYGPDEPRPEDGPAVRAAVKRWHEMGKRCAAAVKVESISAASALDVWIINARGLSADCERKGKDLWMYECRFRGTNYDLHRYWTGLYSFAMHKRHGVKQCWTWGYLHDADSMFRIGREGTWRFDVSGRYEHAIAGPEGPIGSVGLDGMAAGIEDFKVLNALGACAWVDALIARVPSAFWEGTVAGEVPLRRPNMWDLHDTAEPVIDVAAEMRTATKLLLAEKAGY